MKMNRGLHESDARHELYNTLTDIITIFWEFHCTRLERGEMAFAYRRSQIDLGAGAFEPFRGPDALLPILEMYREEIDRINEDKPEGERYIPKQYDPIYDFMSSIQDTLEASWRQFLQLNHFLTEPTDNPPEHRTEGKMNLVRYMQERGIVPGPAQDDFSHEYVQDLLARAEALISEGKSGHTDVTRLVASGINSGVEATVQLRGLFAKHFKPVMPLLLSRISLNMLHSARHEIGVSGYAQREQNPEYHLIDATAASGFRVEQLREYGLGHAIGCPAGQKPSDETVQWLEEYCGRKVDRIMLLDFAERVSAEYDRTIGEWYRGLAPEERERIKHHFNDEVLRMISGERYKALEEKHAREDTAVTVGEDTEVRAEVGDAAMSDTVASVGPTNETASIDGGDGPSEPTRERRAVRPKYF